MTTVIVGGPLANKAGNGGIAWNVLSYVLGLKRLGLKVHLIEEIDQAECVDGRGNTVPFRDSVNLACFRTVTERFGLDGACLVQRGGSETYGTTKDGLCSIAAEASILINVSGHLTLEAPFREIPCKAYIDEDPGFTQFWHANGNTGVRLAGHDFHYTIGENIGRSDCPIPTNGIAWRPTRQPVVLDEWPATPGGGELRFTTVGSWRGAYGPIEYDGRRFGLKVHEFRKVITIPEKTGASFEIALDIHEDDAADLAALREHGWTISDPATVVSDPASFRCYVQHSPAEFSVAQGIYVDTNSGWFSDRSARYLASGKPVLIQDTGFRRGLPVGEGLLAFRDMDEAISGVDRIRSDYDQHAKAARALAEECFDSDKVLSHLLEEVVV